MHLKILHFYIAIKIHDERMNKNALKILSFFINEVKFQMIMAFILLLEGQDFLVSKFPYKFDLFYTK